MFKNFLFTTLFVFGLIGSKAANEVCINLSKIEEYKSNSGGGVSVSPSHVHFKIDPGESKTTRIKVNNDTKFVSKFKVSLFDFNMNGKGKSEFLAPGTGAYSLSQWLSISPSFAELKPGEIKYFEVTAKIPDTDEGHQAAWCILMIEQAKERETIDPGSGNGKTIALGVIPTFAFGIYIYQNPPNVTLNQCEIVDFTYSQKGATGILQFDIENIGNGISYCTTYVDLTNLNNGKHQKLNVKKITIVPGLIREFKFQMPENLEKGNYSAAGVLDYGNSEEIEMAELEFEIK